MKTLFATVAFAALTLSASGQVTSIGPFVGSDQEDMESHSVTVNAGCVPGGIFNNTAMVCTPTGQGIWVANTWSFQCSIPPMAGIRMLSAGPVGGSGYDISFNSPPAKFGGYFGMNHPGGPDIKVSFFAGPTLVSGPTTVLLPVDCSWNWLGWDFGGTGVDRIHVESNYSGTGYVHMDNLEVDYMNCTTEYGQGCPGSLGQVPVLSAPTCAVAGGSATVQVSNALGGANAILLLGSQQAAVSMGLNCFLNVAPLFPVQLNFPLTGVGPGNGGITIVAGVPAAAAGLTVTLQVFVVDPGGLGGFSNSNGLELAIQ